jgi:hypothetical protein
MAGSPLSMHRLKAYTTAHNWTECTGRIPLQEMAFLCDIFIRLETKIQKLPDDVILIFHANPTCLQADG